MSKVKKKKPAATPTRAASRRRRVPQRAAGRRRTASAGRKSARELLPFFLSFCILVCLGAFAVFGYRAVAASNFFNVSKVEVRGSVRSSQNEIESIVKSETERTGTWNADLEQIKVRIEKLSFVKAAAVSRVLPNGIRVSVIERTPAAIANLSSGPVLVDEAGDVIAPSLRLEPQLPFAINGWDETKSLQAEKDNRERVKMYRAMLAEWKQTSHISHVQAVNIKDLRDPIVLTEDSGRRVAIGVGREKFGENLKNGLMAISGKGETFEGVALMGSNLRLVPRQTK